MKKISKLLPKLSLKQIMEINNQYGWNAQGKLNTKTRKILSDYFGKNTDPFLIDKAKKTLKGYLFVEENLFLNSFVDSGAFGDYFKISNNHGIKIIYSRKVYKTKKDLLSSITLKKVKKEFSIQKKASDIHEFVVKPLKVVAVYNLELDEWNGAIVTNHFQGKAINYLFFKNQKKSNSFKNFKDLKKKIDQDLKKTKINHNDIHEGNVLFNHKEFKLIDFGMANLS